MSLLERFVGESPRAVNAIYFTELELVLHEETHGYALAGDGLWAEFVVDSDTGEWILGEYSYNPSYTDGKARKFFSYIVEKLNANDEPVSEPVKVVANKKSDFVKYDLPDALLNRSPETDWQLDYLKGKKWDQKSCVISHNLVLTRTGAGFALLGVDTCVLFRCNRYSWLWWAEWISEDSDPKTRKLVQGILKRLNR